MYREYKPNYDPENGLPYCNKTLYLFAFTYMTIIYSLILLFIIGVGCFVCCIYFLDKYTSEKAEVEEITVEVPLASEEISKV